MRYTSTDILAKPSAAIAQEKITEIAEIKGKRQSIWVSVVVGKTSICAVFDLSALLPKAILQFGTVRCTVEGYVEMSFFFFLSSHFIANRFRISKTIL